MDVIGAIAAEKTLRPGAIESALRVLRLRLLAAEVSEERVARFIEAALDLLAGAEDLGGASVARRIELALRHALPAAGRGAGHEVVPPPAGTVRTERERRWCLKELSNRTGRIGGANRRRMRTPALERRLPRTVDLSRSRRFDGASQARGLDQRVVVADAHALNRLIAGIWRGRDSDGPAPPDIGNPALI